MQARDIKIAFYFIFFFCLSSISQLHGQEIKWASHIVGFSSQFAKSSYSVKQLLGEPQRVPAFGDCGCAWMPEDSESESEYVKVGFKDPIHIQQVLIFENYNPGAIDKVIAYDYLNNEYILYKNKKFYTPSVSGRVFKINTELTPYKVNSIKIVMKPSEIAGYNQIDAIGVSEVDAQYSPQVATSDLFSKTPEPKSMGNGINSEFTEVLPRISPDGNTLFFDRKDHPGNYGGWINDDIWYAGKNPDGSWGNALNIGSPLNNGNHNYICGISEDGTVVTLANKYHRNGSSSTGISQSIRIDSRWITPLNMEIDGFYGSNYFTEYYISPDRTILLISAQKWDSYGKNDLYVSFSEDMMNFSDPQNLGSVINSPGSEMAPFLSSDLEYLYFSSDALPGFGDQDIYVSKRLDDTWLNWSEPENLGPLINSSAWDSHFIISPDGEMAYLASNRERYVDSDILEVKIKPEEEPEEEIAEEPISLEEASKIRQDPRLTELKESFDPFIQEVLVFGRAFNKNNGEYIPAKISFAYLEDTVYNQRPNVLNRQYRIYLRENTSYKVVVSAEGFYKYETVLTLDKINKNKVKRSDFSLKPINRGDVIQLKNIQFDANSAFLKSSSWVQLDTIVTMMLDNPALLIEVAGHTNNKCADDFCQKLSESRAREVASFLVSKGIREHRITPVGYGAEKPIADNKTKLGRMVNQRVEIKIIQ